MNNTDDILKKILLNMRYDASKTLKENKEIIFEDLNKLNQNSKTKSVDVFSRPISFNGKVIKTVKSQISELEKNIKLRTKLSEPIRQNCWYSFDKSQYFKYKGTQGNGYDLVNYKDNLGVKRTKRSPTDELQYYFKMEDQVNLSGVLGITWNFSGPTPLFVDKITGCMTKTLAYIKKTFNSNAPGIINSDGKDYSLMFSCYGVFPNGKRSFLPCDENFLKKDSVNYYHQKEKLDIEGYVELPAINVFPNKTPNISTKTPGSKKNDVSTSIMVASDNKYEYKKEGGKYYFKGKDGTDESIKHPDWVEAKGKGLESIIKNVDFTSKNNTNPFGKSGSDGVGDYSFDLDL
jgi:hypothetical protein